MGDGGAWAGWVALFPGRGRRAATHLPLSQARTLQLLLAVLQLQLQEASALLAGELLGFAGSP